MTTFLAIAGSALVLSCRVVPALAAGNGAGAGGAGHQRAINSGLPPGEPGPLGAPNNPRRPTAEETIATPRNTTPPDPKP